MTIRVDGAGEFAEDDSLLTDGRAGPPPGHIAQRREREGRFAGRDEQFAPEDARLVRRDKES